MRSNLIELRKGLGLTQPEFASFCGITASELCRIEKGQRKGSVYVWLTIADKFELTLAELKEVIKCDGEAG